MVDVIKGSPTNWSWGKVTSDEISDGAIIDSKIGNRIVDQSQVPSGNTGLLGQLFNWAANRIKSITGKANWYDNPDITLATLSAHKTRHASGGADVLTPADIGAAPANLFDSTYTKAFRSVNYVSAANWAVGTGNAPDTGTGGDFVVNGDGNLREWGMAPFGHRGIIWVTRNNDPTSDADGGWSKTITGLDPNKAYLSVVYVKRATSSTNGTFYHGCSGSNTLNLNGTTNTNPYFHSFNIGTLPQNVWCISIGIIKANNDSDTVNIDLVGVYRLDTGAKIVNGTAYKMGTGISQIHRTYFYYSTDSAAELHWYAPGFYKIDGTEPTLAELTGGLVTFCNGNSYANWYAGNSHKSTHATGGTDALVPADIGAAPSSHTHSPSQISPQGAGSGLDTDKLHGRSGAVILADIERNFYDDYEMHMELYYSGHHSGPSIAGMKGMTFDGFQDTARVNTGATTAYVDTANKFVRNANPQFGYVRPVSASYGSTSTGLRDGGWSFSGIANTIDNNTGTYASATEANTTYQYECLVYDLGSVKLVNRIKAYGYVSGGDYSLTKISISLDGSSWTVVDSGSLSISSTTGEWVESGTFTAVVARYIAVEFGAYTNDYSRTFYLCEIQFQVGTYTSSVFQNTTKSLESNASSVTLYLSEKLPSGGNAIPQISANGGTNWESLTLESSRTDPLYSSYIEKKYVRTLQYPGSQLVLKVTLNPSSDGVSYTELKRYGIHWS